MVADEPKTKTIPREEVAQLFEAAYRLYGETLDLHNARMIEVCGDDLGKAALMVGLTREALLYKFWRVIEVAEPDGLATIKAGVEQLLPKMKAEVDEDIRLGVIENMPDEL